MKTPCAGYSLTAALMFVFCLFPIRTVSQQNQTPPDQSQQVPVRPHLDDPTYYDRDGAHDAPYAAKIKADAKAKAQAALQAALAKPTPRTPDGHPNLTAVWATVNGGLPVIISADGKERKVLFGPFDNGKPWPPVPEIPPDAPVYKPEFQAKVKALWVDQTHTDPTAYVCKNPGVPRLGEPDQIVEAPGLMIFLYKQGLAGGNPVSTFRVIPTDGRPHRTDVDPSVMGDSVGHWEGDTFVVDVTLFDDSTWFERHGSFHTEAMHVTERITRKGDTYQYTATVADPNVLAKPWTSQPVTRVIGGADDLPGPDVPCVDNDSAHLQGKEHF